MHIVLLPGLDGGEKLSREFRDFLDHRYTSEVIEYPPTEPLGYDELEHLVRRRLEALHDSVVLIGESFSGPVAIRVAATQTARVVGLVLVATFVEPPLQSFLRHFVSPMLFWLPPPELVIRRYLVGRDAPEALVRSVGEAVRAVSPSVLSRRAKAVMTVDVRDELRGLSLPILYIEGRQDQIVVQRRALAQVRPEIDWRALDAPHLVLQGRPREAATLVNEFVAKLNAR